MLQSGFFGRKQMATLEELRTAAHEMGIGSDCPVFANSRQAARFLGVSEATLSQWSKMRRIPRLQTGRGYGYRIADLVDFVEKRREIADAMKIRVGCVYVITADELYPIVKIGFTKTPIKTRLKALDTSNPFNLYVLAEHATVVPEKAEALVHARLGAQRMKLEWFKLEDGDLEIIKAVVVSAS
jgi:hypothetical protein